MKMEQSKQQKNLTASSTNGQDVKRSTKNPQLKETSTEKKANKVTDTPSREMAKDLDLLSKQMQEANKNYPNKDVATRSIMTAIEDSFTLLQKQDKVVRKQGITNLKAVRAQIESMNDSMLKDRESYIKTIDAALKSLESHSGEIAVLTKDIKEKFLDQLPTFKGLKDSFLSGASPLIPFFMSATKELKEYRKSVKKRVKNNKEKGLSGLEALFKKNKEEKIEKEEVKQETINANSKDEEILSELKIHSNLLEKVSLIEKSENKTIQKDSKNEIKESRQDKKLSKHQLDLMAVATGTYINLANKQLDKISDVEVNTYKLLEIAEKQYAEMEQNTLQSLKDDNKHQLLSPNLLPKEQEKESSGGILDTLLTLLGLKKLKSIGKMLTKGLGSLLGIFGIGKGAGKLVEGLEVADAALNAGKLSKFLKIGKLGGKLLGKISIIGTVLFAIWNFVDGFTDAANILDKTDVDFRDRIAAGLGSIVGGLVGIIDDIAELVGIDTTIGGKKLGEWAKIIVAKGWSMVLHPINTLTQLVDYVEEKWNSFNLSSIGDWISDKVSEMFNYLKDMFTNFIKNQIKNLQSILPDWAIPDSIEQWANPTQPENGVILPPDKTQEKEISVSEIITHTVDKAADYARSVINAGTNMINAPNTTNVTNVHTTPIETRNYDDSIALRLG